MQKHSPTCQRGKSEAGIGDSAVAHDADATCERAKHRDPCQMAGVAGNHHDDVIRLRHALANTEFVEAEQFVRTEIVQVFFADLTRRQRKDRS